MVAWALVLLLAALAQGDTAEEPLSRRLRNGKLHKVPLGPAQLKTFYFALVEAEEFWLYVTPCGGTIKWRLSILHSEAPPNASADAGEAHWRRNARSEELLVQEVGRERMSYSSGGGGLGPGLVRLHFLSPYESTRVELFATTEAGRLHAHFPRLPVHARDRWLHLHNLTHTTAHLAWEHSPSVDWFRDRHIHYCLAVSSTVPFRTYCHLQDALSPVSYTAKSARKSNRLSDAGTPKAAARDRPFVACTKYKNSMSVADLRPNLKYHLSLFAINKLTGASAAYGGLSLKTPGYNEAPRQVHQLTGGRLQSAYLNPARSSFHIYEFPLAHFTPRVNLIVQPCGGYIRIHVFKGDKLLKKSVVSALRRFVITNLTPGILKVKVVNDDNDAKVFKIWAAPSRSADPYPLLPEDPSLKVLDGSRGCAGLDLAWLPAAGDVKYCLYRKLEPDDYFKRLILEDDNQCKGPLSSWSLDQCRVVATSETAFGRASSGARGILQARVSGLAPGRMYRFDLLVSPLRRPSAQTSSYRTLWVKTKDRC